MYIVCTWWYNYKGQLTHIFLFFCVSIWFTNHLCWSALRVYYWRSLLLIIPQCTVCISDSAPLFHTAMYMYMYLRLALQLLAACQRETDLYKWRVTVWVSCVQLWPWPLGLISWWTCSEKSVCACIGTCSIQSPQVLMPCHTQTWLPVFLHYRHVHCTTTVVQPCISLYLHVQSTLHMWLCLAVSLLRLPRPQPCGPHGFTFCNFSGSSSRQAFVVFTWLPFFCYFFLGTAHRLAGSFLQSCVDTKKKLFTDLTPFSTPHEQSWRLVRETLHRAAVMEFHLHSSDRKWSRWVFTSVLILVFLILWQINAFVFSGEMGNADQGDAINFISWVDLHAARRLCLTDSSAICVAFTGVLFASDPCPCYRTVPQR